MRSGVAPTGVDGENDTGGDENMADRENPRRPRGNNHALADCVAQQEETDQDHLRGRLGLAGRIGGKHRAVRERKLTQSGDEKIARDQNDRSPRGDIVRPREANECGGDENFVGQRIHEASEVGLALQASCENAVEVVAEDGEGEGNRGNSGAPRHTAFARGDEDDGEREAQDGKLVGESHSGKAAKVAKANLLDKAAAGAAVLWQQVLMEGEWPRERSGKDFLNVRLRGRSNTLRTWRSGPQGSLEKILRFFQKGG